MRSKNSLLKSGLWASLSLLSVGVTAPAMAAEDAALEEIIVTAQLREEALQDVPIAITVATAEQIERDQIYSFNDLQRITPAVEVSQTFGGDYNGGARMRGVGTNVFNQTANSSVAIVVDQVTQGNASYPQLFDIAQIEVLRGPQGTLFGQTASAGVISVRTANPDMTGFYTKFGFDYAGNGDMGSRFGQSVVRGVVNMPVSDTVGLRFATFLRDETGVQRNVFLGRDNEISDYSARLKALIQPSDRLTINLSAEYNKLIRNGLNFAAASIPATSTVVLVPATGLTVGAASNANQINCGNPMVPGGKYYCSERHPRDNMLAYGLSSQIDLEGERFNFTSVTGYRWKNREQVDLNYSRQVGVFQANDQRIDNFLNQTSQELRWSSKGESDLNWVGGVFFSRYNFETRPTVPLPFGVPSLGVGFSVCNFVTFACAPSAAGPLIPEFRQQDVDVTASAIFADVTYGDTEGWSTFGGLRVTRQKSNFSYRVFPASVAVAGQRSGSNTDNNVSGRLGVRFRPNDTAMYYASSARGYKGSVVEVSVAQRPEIILGAEIPTTGEVGAKFTLAGGRLNMGANLFYSDIKNFQSQQNEFIGTALISIPLSIDLVSKGLEVDLVGLIGENLTINAGYLYNDIRFPPGFIGDDRSVPGGVGGRQFLQSPENKVALSGEYSRDLGGNQGFINLNAVYKSDMLLAARPQPQFIYPAHTTIGASIGMRGEDDKWTVTLYGRNLTDENEPVSFFASTWAGQLDGGVRAWPEGGVTFRSVGLSADFRF